MYDSMSLIDEITRSGMTDEEAVIFLKRVIETCIDLISECYAERSIHLLEQIRNLEEYYESNSN